MCSCDFREKYQEDAKCHDARTFENTPCLFPDTEAQNENKMFFKVPAVIHYIKEREFI